MLKTMHRKSALSTLTALLSAAIVLTVGITPASANTISGTRTCSSQVRVTSTTVAGTGTLVLVHRVTGTGGYGTEFNTPGTRSSIQGSYSGTWSAATSGATGTVTSASSSCSGIV